MEKLLNRPTTEDVDLNRIDLLIDRYCSEEWKAVLRMNTTVLHYHAREYLFKEGQPTDKVHIIRSGKVKVFSSYGKNKERIIRLANHGQVLGHRGFGKEFVYSVSAIALTDTEVEVIPLPVFLNVLKANSLFCYYMMLFFAEELKESERHMKDLTNMAVKQRIAKAIKMNIAAFGFDAEDKDRLSHTISRKDIANLAGTTYETVIRVLSELDKKKVIRIEGKSLRILDIKALRQIIAHG